MRRFPVLLAVTLTGLSGWPGPTAVTATPLPNQDGARQAAAPTPVGMAAVRAADSANAFGLDLFQTLAAAAPGENVFISPTSLSLALGMTHGGAGGGTAAAMARTLHLPAGDPADTDAGFAALQNAFRSTDPGVTVSVANALWADKAFTFQADFAGRCQTTYGATLSSLTLADPAAAQVINDWCARATNNIIPQIVTPHDLRGAAGVLTNAVYFKGFWATKFDRSRTADQPFHPEGRESAYPVPMMHRTISLPYRRSVPGWRGQTLVYDGPSIVKIPYGAGQWVLYAFLPPPGQRLPAFIAQLTDERWRKWRNEFKRAHVVLSLPRFKAESAYSLVEPLTTLGMGKAFSGQADFSRMFDQSGPFYLRDVLHKAVLKVNEESTEAAAATAIVPPPMTADQAPTFQMVFDRPFVCAIVHEPTGAIAFLGAFPHPEPNRG